MANMPERLPLAVGVKVTAIAQFAPAARFSPQLLVCANSPEIVMLEIVSVPEPVLLRLTVFGKLAVPTFCGPKLIIVAERLTPGAGLGVAVGVFVGVDVAVAVGLAMDDV